MKPYDLGWVNGYVSCVSNRHGKFHACFVVMCDDDVRGVVIMGPHKTEAHAERT